MKLISQIISVVAAMSVVGLAAAADHHEAKKDKKLDGPARAIICADSVQNKSMISDAKLKSACEKPKSQAKIAKLLKVHNEKMCDKGDRLSDDVKKLAALGEQSNPLVSQALSTKLAANIQQKCKENAAA